LLTFPSALTSYNSLKYELAHYENRWPVTSLKGLPGLQVLTIDAPFFLRTFQHKILVDFFGSPLPWIADLLKELPNSKAPTAASLSKLIFCFSFHDFGDQFQVMHAIKWETLTDVVKQLYFPNLSSVEMRMKGLDRRQLDLIRQNPYLRGLENVLTFV